MEDAVLALAESQEERIQVMSVGAVGVITKSEVEAQLDAAHRYPRSITRFLKESTSLATLSVDVAESCIYTLPRAEKAISGPSVRLAEICASSYGNLHVGGRIVDADEKTITAQGVAWDLEKNLRVTVEVQRRITDKFGRRFKDDMVIVTGNAAISIALRNAIFRVVPRSYVNSIYGQVRLVAVGDAKTLDARRDSVLQRLQKIGVPIERIFAKLEKRGPEDIGLEDLEVLIGYGTAIKNNEATIDELFPALSTAPAPKPEEEGKRMSIGKKKAEEVKEEKPPEPADSLGNR
jgi:hypothetical protein